MNVVIIISILALLLSILQSVGVFRKGLMLGFVLTTFLLIIHFNFGNDYVTYYEWFLDVLNSHYSFSELFEPNTFLKDPGWFVLYWLFALIFGKGGFFVMVAIISIIEGVIYYKIIRKYVPEKWYWLAMFIYLFQTCLYPLTFSMMRQALVLALILIIYGNVREGKHIAQSIILLVISFFIHKSSIFFIPFLFINYLPLKYGKNISITLIIFLLTFLFLNRITHRVLDYIMQIPFFVNYGSIYGNANVTITFGLGYFLRLIMFGVLLYYLRTKETEDKYRDYVLLAAFSIIILPFETIIPLITRVNYYFQVFYIIAIPLAYDNIKNTLFRNGLLLFFIIFEIYSYSLFCAPSSIFYEGYQHFHTIFSTI